MASRRLSPSPCQSATASANFSMALRCETAVPSAKSCWPSAKVFWAAAIRLSCCDDPAIRERGRAKLIDDEKRRIANEATVQRRIFKSHPPGHRLLYRIINPTPAGRDFDSSYPQM